MAVKIGCPFCACKPLVKQGTTSASYSHHGKFYASIYCNCGNLLPEVTKSAYADTAEEALKKAEAAWETRAA